MFKFSSIKYHHEYDEYFKGLSYVHRNNNSIYSFILLQFPSWPRQQAWQWFKEEDKAIKEKTCPTEYPEWHFKGKTYKNMQAKEATAEQLEADGSCEPMQLFEVKLPAESTTSTAPTSVRG